VTEEVTGEVEQYFGAGSDASKVYGVNWAPHSMLVDRQGRIVFKGNPKKRENLSQDIDDLIEGKSLSGKGVWGDGENSDKGEEGF
jgi:hypothetical protein